MTNKVISRAQSVLAHHRTATDKGPKPRVLKPQTPVSGHWQSNREIDRRKRQIDRGQLREANGLVR